MKEVSNILSVIYQPFILFQAIQSGLVFILFETFFTGG